MIALLFITIVSANNYYLIKSKVAKIDDFVYVAKYGECVAVYDALYMTDYNTYYQREPLFYINRYLNDIPRYYSDPQCKSYSHSNYISSILDTNVTINVNQTYLNNKYDVKVKYNCNNNNTIDIYARTGQISLGYYNVGIYEQASNIYPIFYRVQLTIIQVEGPANQCLSNGYRFEKLMTSSSQNPSNSQNPPNTDAGFEEACKRLFPNSHYVSTLTAGYPCECDTGYDRVNNSNNIAIPFECVRNEWYTKNETCRNNHGQFAYFNKINDECDCENNYVLYEEGFCMEGNRYCKVMYPSENVYYDEFRKSCVCKDKETMNAPGGKIVCWSTYEEVCQKMYGKAHFDKNGESDCSCDEGYKWEYKSEEGYKYPYKCVKVEDDSTANTFMILLLALILALI